MIGSVGLTKNHGSERLEDVEIGYNISEVHQGKGYATEAAIAATQWAFARLKELSMPAKVVGKVEHENWPSRRVLEKAGYSFTHAEEYLSVYEIRE